MRWTKDYCAVQSECAPRTRQDKKDVDVIMEKFFNSFADEKAMETVNRGLWWRPTSDVDKSDEQGAVGTEEGAEHVADSAGCASRADSEATVTYERADSSHEVNVSPRANSDSSNPTHDDIGGEDLGSNDTPQMAARTCMKT